MKSEIPILYKQIATLFLESNITVDNTFRRNDFSMKVSNFRITKELAKQLMNEMVEFGIIEKHGDIIVFNKDYIERFKKIEKIREMLDFTGTI